MTGCRSLLLGCLQIAIDDEDVTALPGGKARLLLAYMILAHDMPQSRKQIAFAFWPDSSDKQALSNLRKLIHDLREALPQIDRYLAITPSSLQWNQELSVFSDVREFERAAQGQTAHELRAAEALYRGELLPGVYEEWLVPKRELLAQQYMDVLVKLVSLSESRGEYSAALWFANKLLAHNKWREETYRTLMRLHALNKDAAAVAQVYQQLRAVLETELGIGPSEESVQLYERLVRSRDDDTAAFPHRPTLVGRKDEWSAMLEAWKRATAGDNAMVVLKGAAGTGKTRLAQDFAQWAENQGFRAAWAGCYPTARALSHAPVTTWLRSLPFPPLCPVAMSELTRLLPELLERYPDLPEPNPIRESWQVIRWYEAIERMLMPAQPLLLVLDDIQWCDAETLRLTSYLLRGGSSVKTLVIATMRTDQRANDAAAHMFADLRLERKLTEIDLYPFAEEGVKRFIAVGRREAAKGEALLKRSFH